MERLGRYELRQPLGRGGFATVYRAWDPLLRREVAIKSLSADWAGEPEMHRRFMLEAQTLAGIEHPHIVAVFDVGEADGRPYFTMPVMEGGSLAGRLRPGIGLPLADAAAIITALADALDTLHARHIVHRDVKAANVMFTGQGRATLMDLGIARDLQGPGLTSRSQVMLSPEAAAPEQIRALPVGPAADIYALGVLAYTLLAGRPPFTGNTGALLHAHVYSPPPPLWELRPGLPGPVYAAVQEALAKDAARRPATAGAFAAALRPAAPHDPPAAPPLPVRRPRSRRWLLGAGVTGGAAAVAAGGWRLLRGASPSAQGNAVTPTPPPSPSAAPATPSPTAPPPTASPSPTPSAATPVPSPPPGTPATGANAAFTFLRLPLGEANTVDVRINPRQRPFSDERVRRAYAHGVEPAVLQEAVRTYAPTSPLLTAGEELSIGTLLRVSFDPVAALRLLEAAGESLGQTQVTLTTTSGTNTLRLAVLLQNQWQRHINARVLLRSVPLTEMAAALAGDQYELLLYSVARTS